MPRDITPLTNALEKTTPGTQHDVYTLLAAWNTSIETVLERGDGGRYLSVCEQYLPEVIELVDTAATNEGIDWSFLKECVDAYPPATSDHYCPSVLVNVVTRCVIRTRIREGVDEIPLWALDYLEAIDFMEDGNWAADAADVYVWGVGHPDINILDRIVEVAETDSEWTVMDLLEYVTLADPDAGITLLERLLRSPDTDLDLAFLRAMEPIFERDFPNLPQYWEPHTELEYECSFTDDQRERLLTLLGETVHPGRLRRCDEQYLFDLQRAADEYGTYSAEEEYQTRR